MQIQYFQTPMAAKVVETADDDEITILHTTPAAFNSGATKSKAISVEDCHPTATTIIDLTHDDGNYDVAFEIPPTKRRRRFYKGESSNSKRNNNDDDTVLRRSFTCEICTDEKPISDSFRIIGCHHSYCTECISNYVAAKLQDNISRIACPVPGCGGFLEPPHCRTILPKAVFERWGDALCEAMMLAEEKFYCPFKNCSALLINDDRNNRNLTQSECPECRRLFCVQCKAAWHPGISCGEFQKLGKDERSSEDIMLRNLAKKSKWVRCPSCRHFVSRSSGCSEMRCRCGCYFCYKCGDKMDKYRICRNRCRIY